MKNIIGVPARKENFYPRKKEIKKITDKISDGNNLQIAAPRRVGKTSILYSLLDNNTDGHTYIFVDTESVYNSEDFFKKILKEVIKIEGSKIKKWLEEGSRFLKKIKGISIAGAELNFNESTEHSYKEDLENLLCSFNSLNDKRLVLLIDEFPQTVLNIIEKVEDGTKEAISFLQQNRDLRLHPDINGKVSFIYTGSIGLNHTVSAISGTAFINDINSIEIGPLSEADARDFLNELLKDKKQAIDEDTASYLLGKIEWLIPFHIQLAVQEITEMAEDMEITNQLIDESFQKIVAARNNNHFEHYASRLRTTFKGNEYNFANTLLCTLAKQGTLTRNEIFDLSLDYSIQDKYKQAIEILIYDGYINNNDDASTFRFNSPILRMWWNRSENQ